MEQNNTHRLTKVAKELGIGVTTLLEFFTEKGVKKLKPNSKIDAGHYEMALNKFGDDKLIREKIREQKEQEEARIKKVALSLEVENVENVEGIIDKEKSVIEEKIDKVKIVEEKVVEAKTDKEKVVEEKVIEEKIDKEKVVEDKVIEEKKDEEKVVEEKKEVKGPKILGKIDIKPKINKKKKKEERKTDRNKKTEQIENKKKKEEKTIENKKEEVKETIEVVEKIKPKKERKNTEKEETKKEKNIEQKVEQKNIKNNKKEIIDEVVEEQKDKEKIEDDSKKITGPKVVGKIDLNKMNLKTRPDKKTKKEKEEERKKRRKEVVKKKSVKKGTNSHNRRPRKRIEKVEINKEGKIINKGRKKSHQKTNKKRTPVVIDEKDVQKQVRETLQKLEQRQKSKAAKFRKEKRKVHSKRVSDEFKKQQAENQILKLTEFITVKEISDMMNVTPNQVIEVCFDLGQPVTINYRLDAELISLITDEFNFGVELVQSSFEEEIELIINDKENQITPRPPIVTVMGHVDHGKTSLLDYIRHTNVVDGESGGITQHIGAYSVRLKNKNLITFIDTPGHEAFTAMRARGTKVTDIAIIIIAADDSIMPQTEEAIDHARAGGVPMVFAINKIDKPGADPEKIKQQLSSKNILVESWGGQYGSVEISAKTGEGIEELLERVALEAEMLELKANPDRKAIGTVLEARLDKGRGYVTNLIVRTGTLKVGDIVVAGGYFGKIKALFDEFNKRVKKVGPSAAIQLLGLNGAPEPGEPIVVMENEKDAREKAEQRLQIIREMEFRARKKHSLEDISRRLAEGDNLTLNIIIKADVKGSVDAISDQLTKLSNEEVTVNVVRNAVGQISESDIMLAAASTAIMIGFNVRPSVAARRTAENKDVEIRLYSVIYDVINDVKAAVKGMLKPRFKEEIVGTAEVMNTFNVSKIGTIAGSIVREGRIVQANNIRLIRDGIVIYSGKLKSLKRFKDDAKDVLKGFECGIGIDKFNDIKVGDFIESFTQIEIERELDD